MREGGLPLFALESRRPLLDFDMVAFTLQYEMSFSNVLNMLDLAGIPRDSGRRTDGFPLIVAGGPCAYNPEPLADFIDVFVIGEGEEAIGELLDVLIKLKRQNVSRQELFQKIQFSLPFHNFNIYYKIL
jgi:radical SAM superfamily enzyme YgiQ (UPF0313 family)